MGLGVIMILFAAVATWNLGEAGFSGYYSSAVRSMSVSWRALWFGAFDPSASITLDKLPGFLVPQAVSARLFGFHAWSLALPQVVEGLVTIVAVFVIGTRWRGEGVGLLTAAALAVTPIMVSMFGHTMEDGLLTMSLALAFLCFQEAVADGRVRPLVFAALWVGVGFQAKMLQAWIIVPAVVIALLTMTTEPFRRRLFRALVFCGITLVASLSWMIAVQLIPVGNRPYFDGSVDDNVFSMVFGYNGLNRFVPGLLPGAAPSFAASVIGRGSDGASPFKLLLPSFTTQVGWFYPLAVAGLVVAVTRSRQRRVSDAGEVAMVVGLAAWLVITVVVLSVSPVPHTAYLAALGVPASILAGLAVFEGITRAKERRPALLRVLVVTECVWTIVILVGTGLSPIWLLVIVPVCGVAASALLGVTTPSSRAAAGVVLAAVALAAAPATWTSSTLDVALAGTANDAYAGPRIHPVPFFFQTDAPEAERTTFRAFRMKAPVFRASDPELTPEQQDLVRFASRAVRAPDRVLFFTSTWQDAEPYILAGGLNVRALGGYSGDVPAPTLATIQHITSRQSRTLFLLPTKESTAETSSSLSEAERIVTWVHNRCTYVPDDAYERATTLPNQSLWECSPAS